MGVNLNPFVDVPDKTVTLNEVIDNPVRDIGVIAKPRTPHNDEGVGDDKDDYEEFAESPDFHRIFFIHGIKLLEYGILVKIMFLYLDFKHD